LIKTKGMSKQHTKHESVQMEDNADKKVRKDNWRETAAFLSDKLDKFKEATEKAIADNSAKQKIKRKLKLAPATVEWKTAVLYYRRSTFKQDTTIESQRNVCLKMAKAMRLSVVSEVTEEISGKTAVEDREKMYEMIETIRPGDVLITYSVSRIARKVDVFYNIMNLLKEKGVRVICCLEKLDSNDAHMAVVWAVHAAFAQQEREAIAERTRMALRTMQRNGLAISRPRWGYRVNPETKKFEPVPEIQVVIKEMIRMRKDNNMTLEEICRHLNSLEIPTPGGGREWTEKTVSNVLIHEMTPEERMKKKDVVVEDTRKSLYNFSAKQEEDIVFPENEEEEEEFLDTVEIPNDGASQQHQTTQLPVCIRTLKTEKDVDDLSKGTCIRKLEELKKKQYNPNVLDCVSKEELLELSEEDLKSLLKDVIGV